MPERDWRQDLVTGLGIAFGLIFLFGISWGYVDLKATQRVIEHYDSQGDANQTDSEIAELCAGLPDLERVECFVNKIESRNEKSQKSRDLHAQEWMAFWAKWMTWAAIGGAFVALYGLYLLRRTWIEARRTADITREIGEAQTRAYVHINEFKPFFWVAGGKARCLIQIDIKNSGMSPAFFNGYRTETDTTNPTKGWSTTTRAKRELGPNGGFTVEIPFDVEVADKSKPISIQTIIRFNYTDIFGGDHWSDVKYLSNFRFDKIPFKKPKITKENSHPSFCYGYVDGLTSWVNPKHHRR